MAKYIIKDLSAKQIEQVLVTSYHALSKPLLIYPSLDALKTHVELELNTSTNIHTLPPNLKLQLIHLFSLLNIQKFLFL